MMKPSEYNLIFPYQFNRDYSVVYNSFRDTIGIVTAREAEFIKTCDRSLGIHNTKTENFEEKGFIIDANTDELSILKVEYLKSKFDPRMLSVVIVPTYQCNLDCVSCYEKLSYGAVDNTVMNEEVQDRVYRWIERNLHGVTKLEIFWHGGEPLTAIDAVKRLGSKLKKLAEERKVEYISKMSTNGYLFTGEIAKVLKEIGITEYKMSLDGCRDSHDCRKRHKDGSATYDTILGNIEESIGCVESIDLRINVDKEDLSDAYELMDILEAKGLSGKVIPRLGKPRKFADQVNDKTFTKEEYSCEAVHYSLHQGIGPKEFTKTDCFCLAGHLNSVIVDGHGTLFKCVSDTGDGQSCGILKENGAFEYNKNFYIHGVDDPLKSEECGKCPYLPLCLGECAYDRKAGNPCTLGSLTDDCWAEFINAYAVKKLLSKMKTKGFSSTGNDGINIEALILGKYGDRLNKFINNAQSTYLLGDLETLAEKSGINLNDEDAELLLQLIQPTELSL